MATFWYRVGVTVTALLAAVGLFRLTAFVVERSVTRSIDKRHNTGDDDW